jgi:hypothetical protein
MAQTLLLASNGASAGGMELDPLFRARSLMRRRRFDDCIRVASDMLQKQPLDQVRLRSNARHGNDQTADAYTQTLTRTLTQTAGRMARASASFRRENGHGRSRC